MTLPNLLKILKKSKSDSPYAQVVDIGSDFVKALVLRVTHDVDSNKNKIDIEGYGKHYLGLKDVQAGVIANKNAVEEAVEAAITESRVALEEGEEVRDCVFGVSGEMSIGLSTTVRVTRKAPEEKIDDKELTEVKLKIEEVALAQAQKEYSRLKGTSEIDLELISSDITNVKVDGFYVSDPTGFKGRTMEVTLFTSFSPSNHINLIQSIAGNVGLNLLTVSSNMYAIVKNLTLKEQADLNAIIIDFGGDSTDVAVVFSGGILAARSVSIGGRSFTKRIADIYDLSYSEAENKKIMYSEGKLESEEALKIGRVIDDTLEDWLYALEVALLDLEGIKTFPNKVFITGGSSAFPSLITMLEEEGWRKSISMKSPMRVKKLSLEDLPSVGKNKTGVDGLEMISPSALGVIGLMAKELNE